MLPLWLEVFEYDDIVDEAVKESSSWVLRSEKVVLLALALKG
jgi:hypothetical protein